MFLSVGTIKSLLCSSAVDNEETDTSSTYFWCRSIHSQLSGIF